MNRTLGAYGVSIGTDLALETLGKPAGGYYDENRHIPSIDILSINYFYLDLTTIMRNFLTSLEEEINIKRYKKEYIEAVVEEVDMIISLTNMMGIKTKLYMPYIDKILNQYKIRAATKTMMLNLQAFNAAKEVYKVLEKEYPVDRILNLSNRNLILSHFAPFILDYDGRVLVSHTGRVLSKRERGFFYKKFKGFNGETLPLNKTLLRVFGERQNVIEYYSISERRRAYAILTNNKVTPLTSEDRCKKLLYKLIRSHNEKS